MEIKLPELGENITSGTVAKILVKPGDRVKKGQNLIELETDKAVVEIPSPQEGSIEEVFVKPGTVIKVGQLIFKLSAAAAAAPQPVTAPASAPKPSTPSPAAAPQAAKTEAAPVLPAAKFSVVESAPPARDVAAAPSVRRFAREIGIDIARVPGSGAGGRISVERGDA